MASLYNQQSVPVSCYSDEIMLYTTIMLLFSIFFRRQNVDSAPLSRWDKNRICSETSDVPMIILENVLGGAYNQRYMSIEKPIEEQRTTNNKRGAAFIAEDFYVDDDFQEIVDDRPAWNVTNHVEISKRKYGIYSSSRSKRAVDYMQEWHCRSKVEWTDLGPNYFPRFLRTVQCLSDKCWFNIYKCKPRSFTVKILRRKSHLCDSVDGKSHPVGLVGLPKELRQMWVWEERAINFCCDCTRT